MKDKKIISIWDFDGTLYDSPLPTDENRELLRLYRDYDRSGWWGRSESLDIELFDINPNPWVEEKYNFHNDENHYKVFMTGRIVKIKESVHRVINQHNFEFDEFHFADGGKTVDFKSRRILEIAEKHNPTEIFFYDDRTEHIPTFRKLGDKLEDDHNIKFRLFHVIGHNGYELKYGKKLR